MYTYRKIRLSAVEYAAKNSHLHESIYVCIYIIHICIYIRVGQKKTNL